MITTLLFGGITTLIILSFISWFYQKPSNLPPGPWNLPILGSLYLLDLETPYQSLTKLVQKYGPIYSFKLGLLKAVIISDAKILKKVSLKDESTGRPPLYVLKYILENKGIMYSTGALWKDQRNFIINFLETCGASKISANKKSFESLVLKHAQEFVEYIKNQQNTLINPSEAVGHFLSGISSAIFLGKEWSRDDQILKDLFYDMEKLARLAAVGGPLSFLPFLRFLPKFKNTMQSIEVSKERVHNRQQKIIDEARKKFNEDKSTSNLIHTFLSQQSKNNSEEIYNMEQLRFLVVDMFAVSIEMTMSSIMWTLLYLAAFEDIQSNVRRELNEVLGQKSPEIDDLPSLPYLEATLAEVSRIRTVVPLGLPHYALEDLFVDGFKIEKGTMIVGLLWGIHMDPNIWKDPEEFRPERFLNDEGKFIEAESLIPFMTGRRMCIGETFAKMAVALFTATVLQNFEVRSDGDLDLTGVNGITLTPKPQKLRFI